MRFDVITLFPELFTPFLSVGITRRAFESGRVEVQCTNPRDFATGNYPVPAYRQCTRGAVLSYWQALGPCCSTALV